MRLPLLLLLLPFVAAQVSQGLYDNITHYAHYCKLTHCINKPGMLNQGFKFVDGGCKIQFCHTERNKEAVVMKVHEAGIDESGTSFITVDKKNKEIVVAFRASVTSSDWFSDFYIVQTPYKPTVRYGEGIPSCNGCFVHLGFYQHLASIHTEIVDSVLDVYHKFPEYKLVIVGHSLGALMASLTAVEFRMMGFYPTVYTFGGPKIFNEPMQKWMNEVFLSDLMTENLKNGGEFTSGLMRVVHDGDYVPMLPPQFHEAGIELFIDKRELPHGPQDVKIIGTLYHQVAQQKKTTNTFWQIVHGYEHRTYFMTLNKCDDVD